MIPQLAEQLTGFRSLGDLQSQTTKKKNDGFKRGLYNNLLLAIQSATD